MDQDPAVGQYLVVIVGSDETTKRRRVSPGKQAAESSSSVDETLSAFPCLVTLNPGVRIASVAAGGRHTLALSDVGQVWGWGYGGEGQLGLGSRIRMVSSPHPVPCIDSSFNKDRSMGLSRGSMGSEGQSFRVPGNYIKAIACGGRHSAAITDAGALLTFGWGLYGQCGQGSTDDELSPTCVSSLLGIRIEGVAAGLWHTICISADGDVYAFGGNQFGQLGTGADQAETLPRLLDAPSLENVHAKVVSCGARHSAVVTVEKCSSHHGTCAQKLMPFEYDDRRRMEEHFAGDGTSMVSTAPNCGDPSYRIRCVSGTLLFDSSNNSYPITSISPSNQRLIIAPSTFLPNTCIAADLPSNGLQLNSSAPFNITSSNTIFYLNCSDSILNSPLNCTSNSLCHVYANGTNSASDCVNTPCCAFRAGGSTTSYRIRVRQEGCRAYRSFVNLDYGLPVSRWPQPGVELQWVLPREPTCGGQTECGSGSTCGPDPNSNAGINRCFCNSGLLWDPLAGVCAKECQNPDGCGKDRTALIAGLTAGLGVALIAALIGFLVYRRHRRIKEEQERLTREREEILNAGGGKTAKVFTGKEMKKATNNFAKDRLLGVGGYGEVYKGILEDGTMVAVKCAKLGNAKGTDQVLNEVRILCQVNHKSLVRLLGCCVELEQPLLVYELSIAHATAEGLAYLHFSAVPPIYHRDVKSSNILLDEKLNGKVSDFLFYRSKPHFHLCSGNTRYLDPEYYRNYQLTDKSDVYSFGVVLLELLTSQKAIDFNRPPDDVNLAVYVQRLVEEERIMDAVDPMLKEGASTLELETMKALGFLAVGCLEERRQNRPSMKEVAEEIEYIISITAAKAAEQ
ncbi:UNVERIFIED_CONTAM: Wall-associated receptor kinase-like 20 [Sesamum calycinum]|uniref:Wall-associated receptor kinase-like 20 n=1 Tax=Sesamum calycinum TaxID=2727403 RepID=A0AAW2RQ23_9LAMI